jgi:hypothetical protein
MLTALIADRAGSAWAYYLDVPWAETLRRHATKPQAAVRRIMAESGLGERRECPEGP